MERFKKRSKKSSGPPNLNYAAFDYPTMRKSPHWMVIIGFIQPLFRDREFSSVPPLDLMEIQKRITLLQVDKASTENLQLLFNEEIKRFFVALREGFKNVSGTEFLLKLAKIWKYLHTVSIPCLTALFVPFETKVPVHKIILNNFRDVLLMKIDLMKYLAETNLEIRASEFSDRSMIPDEISHMLLILQMEVDFYPELQEMLRLAMDDSYEPIWPPLTILEEPLDQPTELTFSSAVSP